MHILSLTTSAAALLASVAIAAPSTKLLSWDEAHKKAKDIVGQMSLDQKVGLATGMGWEKTLCVGNTFASENPDFPSLCLQDGPLGIRFADNVTAGVSGITAAASWDKDLINKRGTYLGSEFRQKGIHMALGPCVDIMRSPRAGRGWEGFGEDPYLQGVAGSETIEGIQSQGVIAVAKHFVLNNQETNRKNSTSNADNRTLHEVYIWPYARMVEAGLGGVMCSYNQLHGTWACEDEYILDTVLKGQHNFRGLIMTDWGAQMSNQPSANAGLDMTMPGDIVMGDGYSWWGSNLTKAVEDGEVPEERVTDMAERIAAAYYKMRQDKGYPEIAVNSFHREEAPEVLIDGIEEHAQITRQIGAAATVVLSNDGVLPLGNSIKKIALIGSDAGPIPQGLQGCADQSCGEGHLAMGWGSGTADFPYLITPTDGITARAGDGIEVVYSYDDYDLETAAALAADADVAIVFSMADSGEEYLVVDDNVGDRKNMSLWHNGDNLIQAVADANENTVVVLNTVGAVLMPWADSVKSIVWGGLAGQESGNALADVLFGDVNPSGRLPFTIAKNEDDYGATIDPNFEVIYHEGLEVGYKHFDAKGIEPLFAFGHGLSYSTFEYSDLKVKAKKNHKKGASVTATVTITNSGGVDGAEVAQAYIQFPDGVGAPPKQLRGFEKVKIRSGKKTKVTFQFSDTELSYFEESEEAWKVPSGEFTIHVGASSRDIRESASFTL